MKLAGGKRTKKAKIKCLNCGHVQDIDVPKGICLQFYKCERCGKMINSPKGSCCVICAYSDTKCPVSVG